MLAMAFAGAGALWIPRLFAQNPAAPITKVIPKTGQRLPVIGIGTNVFRAGELDNLRPVLQRMVELGGSVIDTAASYGESEQVIGQIVAQLGIRSKVFLSTKLVGGTRRGFGAQISDEDSFNRSLKRLRTDYVDLLQVHNLEGVDELWPQLMKWKQVGRIRYIGMTASFAPQHARMLELMRQYPLDFIEVDYSIGDRDAARAILPLAQARRMAVIADVPFGGRGGPDLGAVRNKPLPPFAAEIGAADWAQLMLKYVVSHPAVTCAIPGGTTVSHVEDDQQAGHGRLPGAAMRKRLEQYWDQLVA
jgi:aryl-alcohol dehydrogenase-like predicted oxidoreductase